MKYARLAVGLSSKSPVWQKVENGASKLIYNNLHINPRACAGYFLILDFVFRILVAVVIEP